MNSIRKSSFSFNNNKGAVVLITLPLLFVLWVVLVMIEVNGIRSDVADKVNTISYLNSLREDFTDPMVEGSSGERASRKVNLINELSATKKVLSDSLYQSIEKIYLSNKSSQFDYLETLINKEVRGLRGQLGADSMKLSGLWTQASLIGIIACVFAFVSAIFYIRNVNAQKNILRANSELKELNKHLNEKGIELGQMNDTKDRLFAIIGHDLRSPINSLKGLFDLLDKHTISEEEFKHYASKLRNNVEHVLFTLNNLLLWAHAQMQGIETHAKPIFVAPIIEEVQQLLQEFANGKGVQLSVEITGKQRVYADPDHVKLIMRNLISNAIKFTPGGGTVRVLGSTLNGSPLFSVIDSGVGMSDATLQSLFKKQSYKASSGTNGEKGTGLGLVLCHDFVKKNGGSIWAESIPGKGSTFHFTLPDV